LKPPPLPRVSGLVDANPATTSMIEVRIREARANGKEPQAGANLDAAGKDFSSASTRRARPAKTQTSPRITALTMTRSSGLMIKLRRTLRRKRNRKAKTIRGCRTCLTLSGALRPSHSS